jgi:hypothetical protein
LLLGFLNKKAEMSTRESRGAGAIPGILVLNQFVFTTSN